MIYDVQPLWKPRSIQIQAGAELLENGGVQFVPEFAAQLFKLHPVRVIPFGINTEGYSSWKVMNRFNDYSQSHVIV